MKIVDGFEFICVNDKIMAVSTGNAANVYTGIVNLNRTAYKIWNYLKDGLSIDEIANRLSEEYEDLSVEDARKYTIEFADKLIEKGILIED